MPSVILPELHSSTKDMQHLQYQHRPMENIAFMIAFLIEKHSNGNLQVSF